jgi:hypothetical protein
LSVSRPPSSDSDFAGRVSDGLGSKEAQRKSGCQQACTRPTRRRDHAFLLKQRIALPNVSASGQWRDMPTPAAQSAGAARWITADSSVNRSAGPDSGTAASPATKKAGNGETVTRFRSDR